MARKSGPPWHGAPSGVDLLGGPGLKGLNGVPKRRVMTTRELIILAGLGLAAWGHLLLHELLGAESVWVRLDERFPPGWRSEPSFAGHCLLALGALGVIIAVLG